VASCPHLHSPYDGDAFSRSPSSDLMWQLIGSWLADHRNDITVQTTCFTWTHFALRSEYPTKTIENISPPIVAIPAPTRGVIVATSVIFHFLCTVTLTNTVPVLSAKQSSYQHLSGMTSLVPREREPEMLATNFV
jgi:hypothetical protein